MDITITVSRDNKECSFKYSLVDAENFRAGKDAYHLMYLDMALRKLETIDSQKEINCEGAKTIVDEKRKKFEEDMQFTLTRPLFKANNTQKSISSIEQIEQLPNEIKFRIGFGFYNGIDQFYIKGVDGTLAQLGATLPSLKVLEKRIENADKQHLILLEEHNKNLNKYTNELSK